MDSCFHGNDKITTLSVIPAQAGIQNLHTIVYCLHMNAKEKIFIQDIIIT